MASSKKLLGVRYTETSTTPLYALGTKDEDTEGRVYQYVQANGAITLNDYVKIDDDNQASSGTTTLLPATEPAMVGNAPVAFADNAYGWVIRKGKHTGRFALNCAGDVKIYTTATAGVVDDTSTTLINGLKLIATITTAGSYPAYASCEMTTAAA